MPNLVTNKFKIHNAEQFIESLSESSATNLYLFIGKVDAWSDETDPPAPTDSVANSSFDYWRSMISAKKITSADVSHIIPRVNWESNTAYTAHSQKNNEQSANNFYVVTDQLNVYKCLQNNIANGASTIRPTGTGTGLIELSDGYKWKFMYSISPQDTLKFTTSEYIPVKKVGNLNDGSLQYTVEQASVDGAIDVINRTSNGNYLAQFSTTPTDSTGVESRDFVVGEIITGETSGNKGVVISYSTGANTLVYFPNANALFTSSEIVSGNTSGAQATLSSDIISTYKFEENTFASVTNTTVLQLATDANTTTDGVYVGSTLYVVNNAGRGEQSKISAYDAALRRVTVETPFTITPNTSSGYTISPTLSISGDGNDAKARSTGNSTFGVKEILVTNKGLNYTTASITISANSSHGSGANAEVVIGPVGGHGFNAIEELAGNRVMVDSRITGNESGFFTTENEFRQVGLVRDPLQSANANAFFTSDLSDQSTKITISQVGGTFQADEVVFQGDSLSNSTANGVVIDFLNNNKLRLNQVQGTFVSNSTVNTVTGNSSGASATVVANGVTSPDMKPYSGDILYIENRTNVTRATNQIEDFKIVLEF
tara:strand:- start:11134 stop:12936 length:1803 start_codon:yes stop_codon:yes gene_type:complete